MLTACACMGPMYGEPHCYCTMKRLGLPLNEAARAEEDARAKAQLAALFAPGGAFHVAPIAIVHVEPPRCTRCKRMMYSGISAPPTLCRDCHGLSANARLTLSRNKREGWYHGWVSRDYAHIYGPSRNKRTKNKLYRLSSPWGGIW